MIQYPDGNLQDNPRGLGGNPRGLGGNRRELSGNRRELSGIQRVFLITRTGIHFYPSDFEENNHGLDNNSPPTDLNSMFLQPLLPANSLASQPSYFANTGNSVEKSLSGYEPVSIPQPRTMEHPGMKTRMDVPSEHPPPEHYVGQESGMINQDHNVIHEGEVIHEEHNSIQHQENVTRQQNNCIKQHNNRIEQHNKIIRLLQRIIIQQQYNMLQHQFIVLKQKADRIQQQYAAWLYRYVLLCFIMPQSPNLKHNSQGG